MICIIPKGGGILKNNFMANKDGRVSIKIKGKHHKKLIENKDKTGEEISTCVGRLIDAAFPDKKSKAKS